MSFDIKIVNGDFLVSPSGEVQIVESLEKLKQDVIKILLTEIGTNVYHPWYGSELSDGVVGYATSAQIIAQNAEMAVTNALENIMALQAEQMANQTVTPQEALGAIQEVSVEQEPSDPRQWNVRVKILTRALTEITEDFSIKA